MSAIGSRKADRLVREFMALGVGSFTPIGLPVYQQDNNTYEDAVMFYATIGELYYKMALLLAYAGYPEAPVMYFSLGQALVDTGGRLEHIKIEPEAKQDFVRKTYRDLVGTYCSSTLLLAAPEMIPDRGRPVVSVHQVLRYTYLGADMIFHLARTGSAAAYQDSGFMIPGFMDAGVDVHRTCERMLDTYKEAVARLVQHGC